MLQHVSPIEWDNVILYGQYVLDRARVRYPFWGTKVTTLSRRNSIVTVSSLNRAHDGPIVDSTGSKILGCSGWNAHKPKASNNCRN